MQFKIQVVVAEDNGETITEELFALDKSCDGDGLVGLSLPESKRLLKKLQQVIVLQQTSQYTASHRCCPHCDRKRRIKGSYDIQFRTLFGIIPIPNARLYYCKCEEASAKGQNWEQHVMVQHSLTNHNLTSFYPTIIENDDSELALAWLRTTRVAFSKSKDGTNWSPSRAAITSNSHASFPEAPVAIIMRHDGKYMLVYSNHENELWASLSEDPFY